MSAQNPINEDELTPADRELEAALGSLRPSRAAVSRDALMFEAGRRAGRRPLVLWRAAAGALAASLVVAVSLPRRESPRGNVAVSEPPAKVIPQPVQVIPARQAEPEQFAYLELRRIVLSDGVEAIPRSTQGGGDASVPTLNPLLESRP